MPAAVKADAARVRQLLAQGMTQTQVAKRLGFSKSVICRIANTASTEAKS